MTYFFNGNKHCGHNVHVNTPNVMWGHIVSLIDPNHPFVQHMSAMGTHSQVYCADTRLNIQPPHTRRQLFRLLWKIGLDFCLPVESCTYTWGMTMRLYKVIVRVMNNERCKQLIVQLHDAYNNVEPSDDCGVVSTHVAKLFNTMMNYLQLIPPQNDAQLRYPSMN